MICILIYRFHKKKKKKLIQFLYEALMFCILFHTIFPEVTDNFPPHVICESAEHKMAKLLTVGIAADTVAV